MSIVDKYDIILFDMDGVITSEYRYWDCAALTVYYSLTGLDGGKKQKQVFDLVFNKKKTLDFLKKAGINSNWDLTYVLVSAGKILNTTDFEKIGDYLENLNLNALKLYEFLEENNPVGKRDGEGYEKLKDIFQYYYWGDEMFEKMWQKKPYLSGFCGFYNAEEPVIELEKIKSTLLSLKEKGKILGVGTGRVFSEASAVTKLWNIYDLFDENRFITYTEVLKAQKTTGIRTLTKPHPFMFLKGMLGKNFDDTKIISGNYDKSLIGKTLVVGDAGADILSARAAGMDFAAVLTGVGGKSHREFFEKEKADYILDDMSWLNDNNKKER